MKIENGQTILYVFVSFSMSVCPSICPSFRPSVCLSVDKSLRSSELKSQRQKALSKVRFSPQRMQSVLLMVT